MDGPNRLIFHRGHCSAFGTLILLRLIPTANPVTGIMVYNYYRYTYVRTGCFLGFFNNNLNNNPSVNYHRIHRTTVKPMETFHHRKYHILVAIRIQNKRPIPITSKLRYQQQPSVSWTTITYMYNTKG